MIPEVTRAGPPAPRAERRYEAWFAESFEAGRGDRPRDGPGRGAARRDPALRRGGDRGSRWPSRARAARRARSSTRYLRLRRRSGGCLMIVGFEGERGVGRAAPRAGGAQAARAAAPSTSARRAGRSWERGRYHGPYLRDTLLDLGAMVETLETSHTWSRLDELYTARSAPRSAPRSPAQGTPGLVFCHLSHAYPDGASLYFTFIARARPGRRDRAVGARSRGPPARRSSPPAARSPTTTRSAATTPPTWRPRSGARPRGPAGRQGAPRPGRDHEPRQAARLRAPTSTGYRPGLGA